MKEKYLYQFSDAAHVIVKIEAEGFEEALKQFNKNHLTNPYKIKFAFYGLAVIANHDYNVGVKWSRAE